MKLDSAIAFGKRGAWTEAQIRLDPQSRCLWFVILRDEHNKSFILADNDDTPITSDDFNELANLIRSVGLKEFIAFL